MPKDLYESEEWLKRGGASDEAEMSPLTYRHKKGTGGAGNSPVKYVKREGSLENKNYKDCSRHMRGK